MSSDFPNWTSTEKKRTKQTLGSSSLLNFRQSVVWQYTIKQINNSLSHHLLARQAALLCLQFVRNNLANFREYPLISDLFRNLLSKLVFYSIIFRIFREVFSCKYKISAIFLISNYLYCINTHVFLYKCLQTRQIVLSTFNIFFIEKKH